MWRPGAIFHPVQHSVAARRGNQSGATTAPLAPGRPSQLETQQQLEIPAKLLSPARIPQAPWTIDLLGIDSSFDVSGKNEIVLKYEIGKDRQPETYLRLRDCATEIEDITVNSTNITENKNTTHDLFTLTYSIDKSAIANSSIWNATSNTIELCHRQTLINPPTGNLPKMTVAEHILEFEIQFNLEVEYSMDNSMDAGTIETADDETSVSNYVLACQCAGVDNFTCSPAVLVPSTQLYVCIKSVSPDVEIDQLVSMVVSQPGSTNMTIVDMTATGTSAITIPSIANMAYVAAENGVVVATFIPANLFNYATGTSITVYGRIDMQLKGSTRQLRASILPGVGFNADGNGEARFTVEADLQDEVVAPEEGARMAKSGSAAIDWTSYMLVVAFFVASVVG